jgi:hypothetical protein
MGDEESNELSVEYEFKKNYKLKLSQESALPPGVDLEWGKDY